ncbi:MAG: hypothetical protein Q7T72_09945 [Bacteroidales bacterium]|nr:hypothetical protein [Bacteroidales bacterium]
MEERGYIEVKVEGKIGNKPLKPEDVDIAEIKDIIGDVESFLYPGRAEKAERPHISYKIEEGSAKHYFHLPISAIFLFNGLTGEIASRGTLDFLDFKRAQIIEKFQRKALEKNYEITFTNSLSEAKTLIINKDTKYFSVAANFIETELILYGKIDAEGGVNPNFHIETKEYGRLTISATVEQLLEGEKRLYKFYGIRVSGKQSLLDGKPDDLKLLNYIEYNPVFNRTELDLLIERATPNLSKITDVDAWLNQLRAGAYA